MAEGKYLCVIWSDSDYGRQYEFHSTSASKAAFVYGRQEAGETITIIRKRSLAILSRVKWIPEIKDYVQISHPKYLEQ